MEQFFVTLGVVNMAILLVSIFSVFRSWGKLKDILHSEPLDAIVSVSRMNGQTYAKDSFEVIYKYVIDGLEYEGKVDHRIMSNHRGYVERHPPGTNLKVYVSNKSPGFSLVQKPTTFEIAVKIIMPYIIVLGIVNTAAVAYLRGN